MHEIVNFDAPTRVIAHFQQDEDIADRTGGRLVYYQVELDNSTLSPSGEFIRLNFTNADGEPCNEIHGWIRVEDIVIDEVLESLVEQEWVANG